MATKTDEKINLTTLSMKELLEYEQAVRLICEKYEKSAGMSRGYGYEDYNMLDPIVKRHIETFQKYNNIHEFIYKELERRVNTIAWE